MYAVNNSCVMGSHTVIFLHNEMCQIFVHNICPENNVSVVEIFMICNYVSVVISNIDILIL